MSKRVVKRKKVPAFVPFVPSEKEVAEKTKASILKHNPGLAVILHIDNVDIRVVSILLKAV